MYKVFWCENCKNYTLYAESTINHSVDIEIRNSHKEFEYISHDEGIVLVSEIKHLACGDCGHELEIKEFTRGTCPHIWNVSSYAVQRTCDICHTLQPAKLVFPGEEL